MDEDGAPRVRTRGFFFGFAPEGEGESAGLAAAGGSVPRAGDYGCDAKGQVR